MNFNGPHTPRQAPQCRSLTPTACWRLTSCGALAASTTGIVVLARPTSQCFECLVLAEGRSCDARLECFTHDFQDYCARARKTPYSKRLTPALFGVQTLKDQPSGSWVKGGFTTDLTRWLVSSFPTFLDGARPCYPRWRRCVASVDRRSKMSY